jgi:ketosteroid isomerase-like protein
MRISILPTVLLACALVSCNKQANDPNLETARPITEQINKALNSGDSEQLKSTLASDAVLLRGVTRQLSGRDTIAERYAAAFKQVKYDVSLASDALEPAGDFAIDRGKFSGTLKTVDGKTSAQVKGRYFHVLHLEPGGNWKLWRGVWTFASALESDTTSCDATGARSCCCKDIGGNDCVARPNEGCSSTYPVPILLP